MCDLLVFFVLAFSQATLDLEDNYENEVVTMSQR